MHLYSVSNEAYSTYFRAHIQVALTSVQISRWHGMLKNVCYLLDKEEEE